MDNPYVFPRQIRRVAVIGAGPSGVSTDFVTTLPRISRLSSNDITFFLFPARSRQSDQGKWSTSLCVWTKRWFGWNLVSESFRCCSREQAYARGWIGFNNNKRLYPATPQQKIPIPCDTVVPGHKEFSGEGLIEEEDDPDYGPATACYRDLFNNTATPMMEFEDFPFPKGTPWFVPQTRIHQYFKDYARNYGIDKYIKFDTKVEKVERTDDKRQWVVTLCSKERLVNGQEEGRVRYRRWQDTFDAVVGRPVLFMIPSYQTMINFNSIITNILTKSCIQNNIANSRIIRGR